MSSSNRPRFRGSLDGAMPSAVAPWDPDDLGAVGSRMLAGPAPPAEIEAGGGAAPHDPGAEERRALEARIEEAFARGYEEGRAEGAAAEAERVKSAIVALDRVAAAFEERQPAWLEALEKNLVALSTAVARAVIGRELKGQADDIASLVHRAVTEFPLASTLRVRMNPVDLSAISSPLSGDAVTAGRDVRWIPDPSIAPGGCFVEGPESLVDGRVEKALEQVYSTLVYG